MSVVGRRGIRADEDAMVRWVRRQAGQALTAAFDGAWDRVPRLLEEVGSRCGGAGVQHVLIAWCNAYVDHALGGERVEVISTKAAYVNSETGALEADVSTTVPVETRWAGKLLQARVAGDERAWLSVLHTLPKEAPQAAEYIVALLDTIITSMNMFPRGYALMGVPGRGTPNPDQPTEVD